MDAVTWSADRLPMQQSFALSAQKTQLRLFVLLAVAFTLRAAIGIINPTFAHPDEIFQYQEPANRILTGHSVLTWEWVWHVRSWVFPGLVTPVMALAHAISPNPMVYWDMLTLLMSALSMPTVWVAYRWGCEEYGESAGLVAGATIALWCEFAYFDSHLLMDTVTADLLLPALYFRRRYCRFHEGAALKYSALMLGAIACARPQLAPVVLVPGISLLVAAWKRRDVIKLVAVTMAPVLLWGAIDWVTLGTPWQSVWLYCYVNLKEFTGNFSIDSPSWYLNKLVVYWAEVLPFIVFFCWKGAKRFELEFATGCFVTLFLSLVGHKEMRFVLPGQTILLALAGIGLARCQTGWNGFWARRETALALIMLASLDVASFHSFKDVLRGNHASMRVAYQINRDRTACGVYFFSPRGLLDYPGYTLTRPGIALTSNRYDSVAANIRHANYLITLGGRGEVFTVPAEYDLKHCYRDYKNDVICVYHRPGGCDGQGASMAGHVQGEWPQNPDQNLLNAEQIATRDRNEAEHSFRLLFTPRKQVGQSSLAMGAYANRLAPVAGAD